MKLAQDLEFKGKIYKAGTDCPEAEVVRLLLHNREYLNIKMENGLPVLSKEEEKKYDVSFKPTVTPMKIEPRLYSQESLTIKLNKLKSKEFKLWAEKQFGENKIDRRKSSKAIITQILKIQEAKRR